MLWYLMNYFSDGCLGSSRMPWTTMDAAGLSSDGASDEWSVFCISITEMWSE